MLVVTLCLLTYLAGAGTRKMSGWDFPRRQTEITGKTPSLLTYYHQVLSSYQSFSIFLNIGEVRFLVVLGTVVVWEETMTPAFLLPPLLLPVQKSRYL